MSEAIFLAEYSNIPAGIDVLDQLVKRSAVSIVYARPVCIGKYLIVLGGEVDAVSESRAFIQSEGSGKLLCEYLLTNAHKEILAYFRRAPANEESVAGAGAIGLFEASNAPCGFQSLDRALKSGQVNLARVWLGHFIGGKFCYILTGRVGDVETAVKAARDSIDAKYFVDSRIIPSPDPITLKHLIRAD